MALGSFAFRQDPQGSPPRSWSREDSWALGGLLLLAILLRLPHILAPYVINPDAIPYIKSAQTISYESLYKGFRQSHPSLYPISIAFIYSIIGDWVFSARILSLVFGVLTVIPLYLLSREVLQRSMAWLPVLFFCISPKILHTSLDVVRDPVFWFFFALFLWLLIVSIRKNSWFLYLITGITALLSITFRADGAFFLLTGTIFAMYCGARQKKPKKTLVKPLIILLPAFIIVITLFVSVPKRGIIFHDYKKFWIKTQNIFSGNHPYEKQMDKLFSQIKHRRVRLFVTMAWNEKPILFTGVLLMKTIKVIHPIIFVPFLIGLFQKKNIRDPTLQFLIFLILTWFVVCYIHIYRSFGFNDRYFIPAALLSYFFAAEGFLRSAYYLQKLPLKMPRRTLAIGILAIILLATIPRDVLPRRQQKLVRRQAGEWVHSLSVESVANPFIITHQPRVVFYADGQQLPYRRLFKNPPANKVFLVFSEERGKNPSSGKKLAKIRRAGWKVAQVKKFSSANEEITIYQLKR